MKKNTFNIIISVLILLSLVIGIVNLLPSNKVVFVRSGYIVENFEGMIEAQDLYKNKLEKWQNELDSLNLIYQTNVEFYQENNKHFSKKEKIIEEKNINKLFTQIKKYKENIEKKAVAENEKITQGALNQINDFIVKYAESKGYTLVLGSTISGNILYGKDVIDITEELLTALNSEY